MTVKTWVNGVSADAWIGGTWSPSGDPTSSDDVIFNFTGDRCDVNGAVSFRSIDLTGFANNLSGAGAFNVGDGTRGDFVFDDSFTNMWTGSIVLVSTTTGNLFTSAGVPLVRIQVNGAGGGWTLQDALTLTDSQGLALIAGTLNTNGQSISSPMMGVGGSTTRSLTLGASVITLTASGTVWTAINGRNSTASGITLSCGTSVILLTDTSSSNKTINNANLTYHIFRLTMGGTGTFTFLGAGTFHAIQTTGTATAITIKFTHTTTYTFTGDEPLPSGTSGNLVTLNSSSNGTTYTFDLSGQTISVDYMNIKDLTVTNGTLYCGTHSTNSGGNNANVIFTAPPSGPPLFPAMQLGCRVGF